MNYYKDKKGHVYAFDDDQLHLVTTGMVKMSQQEVEQHLNQPAPLSRADVEVLRLRAYNDPITGSDRYFAEAARLTAMGAAAADIEAATAMGVARAEEIVTMYPWPDALQ
ncbi:hypothetical protein [Aeromonas veronii]|uniref:hypothetical protein n=1 Tax=Aeromonas veronii TaxID=654 RepID=UPI003BA36C82